MVIITNASHPLIGPDISLLMSGSNEEFYAWSPDNNFTSLLGNVPQEGSSMPPTSPALGNKSTSRAMPLDLPDNIVPSNVMANAASKPMATETAPTVEAAAAIMVN